MTNQTDLKKLAQQMAGSMNSFDNLKDFQKQLMQSFINTALGAEMNVTNLFLTEGLLR